MRSHRLPGRRDERLREFGADVMPPIVDEHGELALRLRGELGERPRGGVAGEHGGGEFAVERPHVARELGKDEIHHTVELLEPVLEVVEQSVA